MVKGHYFITWIKDYANPANSGYRIIYEEMTGINI